MQKFPLSLFYNLQAVVEMSSFYRKYHLIFQCLSLSKFPDKNYGVGRTGYSRHAMLKAFIIKHIEQIKSVPRLIEFLDSHPILTHRCGFEMGALPDESQFYRFIKEIPTSLFEDIHTEVNRQLIAAGVASLDTFLIDSKPVMAATRENNFKNPKRNTHNKEKRPKRNLQATLGYYSYQEVQGKKDNFIFFWGYRTHVMVSKEGVPLVTKTLPNNSTDAQVAVQLIKKLKRLFKFKKGALFIADAAYDVRELYNLIVNTMKSQAFIPLNPRNRQPDKTLGHHGCPLCDAGLEMKSAGSWTEGPRTRLKFRCPLKADSKVAANYPKGCPIQHPSLTQGKAYGCTQYSTLPMMHALRYHETQIFSKKLTGSALRLNSISAVLVTGRLNKPPIISYGLFKTRWLLPMYR
ncbi:MAG: transposase [Chitinophagaceae bacterium]|nr:transposase [Chitinophagaceae bacterium]